MADIRPGRDDGREHHEAEGEERHARHGATKPEDFTVGDENNGQVLEDGVDGDGKVFEGPGRGIDHADEKEGDGEPLEPVSELLENKSRQSAHFLASSVLKSRYVIMPARFRDSIAITQTVDCKNC